MLLKYDYLLDEAAKCPDPTRRLALSAIHAIAGFNDIKNRHKKQFNPILGETYELVSDNYRFISEQISHHPPISAMLVEGKAYKVTAYTHVD